MPLVLVVDDEFGIRDVLEDLLGDEGYRTASAPNGLVALEKMRAERPDLVLLDYMMPVMNGADMGEALRGAAETRHIKILMNSSLPEDAVRQHFSKYDAFLRKPYNVDVALSLISALLRD